MQNTNIKTSLLPNYRSSAAPDSINVKNPEPLVGIGNPLLGIRDRLAGIQNSLQRIHNPPVGIQNLRVEIRNPLVEIRNPLVEIRNPLVQINFIRYVNYTTYDIMDHNFSKIIRNLQRDRHTPHKNSEGCSFL